MTLTELLTRYRAGTGTERADLARISPLAAHPDAWDRSTPLHLTASAVIVHPPTARVLLRWHQRQQAWQHVGGHADPGEADPLAIALREGQEETGLDDLVPWPDAGLVHVAVVPVRESASEPAHEHADLRFVLATDRPDEARPEKPQAPLRWLDIEAAVAAMSRPNLRETMSRVARLLNANGVAATSDDHPTRLTD
ncbi:MAG: NUDIX hydrolase [Actinobacteria bacterium 13_2_20CM_2_72_6]|nr:MAG: NUDIX hydrolase [Actinobacteria bacterium 13_2_20CM_2_72_6]